MGLLVPALSDLPPGSTPWQGMDLPLLVDDPESAEEFAEFFLGGMWCPGPEAPARRVAMGCYLEHGSPSREFGVLACEFADDEAAFAVAVELRQSRCRKDSLDSGAAHLFVAGPLVALTWRDEDASAQAEEYLARHVRQVLGLAR